MDTDIKMMVILWKEENERSVGGGALARFVNRNVAEVDVSAHQLVN